MSVQVDFIYDFGSPNAYLAHRLVKGIEERTGATFNYIPCLLGGIFKATGNRSPFLMFQNVKGKLGYDRIEFERFIRRHKLSEFLMNPHFPVNTLLMMRAAVAAEIDGFQDNYIAAGMAAMWEKGLKMDDPDIFVSAMNDAGVDGQTLLARANEDSVKEHLKNNTNAAVEQGVFGIPTFFVEEEMFFGKDRLEQLEREL
ncbi:2-hydroxychromene-2-carboxylate isomerase [Ruegeria lacuscaerulensis]|uniref:2-hydroxychromene-2-carboxylate isomerase n=1 Tax=Ruegeria lacuscaerulensis TaxID=55218 RepID=UPI0014814C84|nr:2-hydroxychromene-2-carboxylate isomerase [Ruegeria lacuscaerulensis]